MHGMNTCNTWRKKKMKRFKIIQKIPVEHKKHELKELE